MEASGRLITGQNNIYILTSNQLGSPLDDSLHISGADKLTQNLLESGKQKYKHNICSVTAALANLTRLVLFSLVWICSQRKATMLLSKYPAFVGSSAGTFHTLHYHQTRPWSEVLREKFSKWKDSKNHSHPQWPSSTHPPTHSHTHTNRPYTCWGHPHSALLPLYHTHRHAYTHTQKWVMGQWKCVSEWVFAWAQWQSWSWAILPVKTLQIGLYLDEHSTRGLPGRNLEPWNFPMRT